MNEIRTLNIDEACQLLHTHKSTLFHKQFFNFNRV